MCWCRPSALGKPSAFSAAENLPRAQAGSRWAQIYSVLSARAAGQVMSATPMGPGVEGEVAAGLAEPAGRGHTSPRALGRSASTGKSQALSAMTRNGCFHPNGTMSPFALRGPTGACSWAQVRPTEALSPGRGWGSPGKAAARPRASLLGG